MELPSLSKESATLLRKLLDQIQTHLRALKSLEENVDYWDTLLIYIITSKIDRTTHKEWEKSLTGTTMPKFNTFVTFLENRCHILQATDFNTHANNSQVNSSDGSNKRTNPNSQHKRQALTVTNNTANCVFCQGTHKIFACEQFRKLAISDRVAAVKSHTLCFNCLNKGHRNDDCKWQGCKKCGRKHNTLLHYEKNDTNSKQTQEVKNTENSNKESSTASLTACNAIVPSQILLSTALVDIQNSEGKKSQARILLDTGSQSNFMTKKFADALGLPVKKINVPVEGLNQLQTRIKESISTSIFSKQSNYTTNLEFLILSRICDYLPGQYIDKQSVNIPENVKLADPEFYKPREIDALLGYFWEIEEIVDKRFLSEEECQVESFYKETTRRDPSSGKYIVRLPFNDKLSNLGHSYHMAKRRFESTERKLNQNPLMKSDYDKFMREYIELEHMSEVPETAKNEGYFMPHHAVSKQLFDIDKFRVVFNASAKTNTGLSLNNCLKVGPTIQQTIFSVIARFRTHQYAFTTDIEKMYRQILVDERDTLYQQILYRTNESEPIKIYRANTVTYGTASAPFLAIRTLFQLADDVNSEFPEVAEVLKRDLYVDDGVTGADTFDEAMRLRDNLITVTNSAGLKLRKWASNEPQLLESLPDDTTQVELFSKSETQGALGVQWNTAKGVMKYKIANLDESKVTKRTILSNIAKLYDPIGLLGPVIVTTKLLMQGLWKCEVDWDESVPIDIQTNWNIIKSQLKLLDSVEFDRKVIINNSVKTEIHGFCDASEKAYGACIYIRSINKENEVLTNLLCSKNRVAPLKSISLPKLELCGALLLSRLLKVVKSSLCKEIDNIYLWSDSTITLQWIQTQPHLLKTFVANRVSEIRTNTFHRKIIPQIFYHEVSYLQILYKTICGKRDLIG